MVGLLLMMFPAAPAGLVFIGPEAKGENEFESWVDKSLKTEDG